jgi:hypothetical protein
MLKSCARQIAAFTMLCSGLALDATPLLFINYSPVPTEFAAARAGALALPHSVAGVFTDADLAGKSVVIMPGTGLSDRLMNIEPILSSFVQEGGYLWINLAGAQCGQDVAPGGVGFVSWACGGASHDSGTIAEQDHSYFTGTFAPGAHTLTSADFLGWEYTDGGHVTNVPSNATTLLSNPNGASLTEYAFGKGWVVVSSLTYGWGQNGARTAAMDNMLLYAAGQVRGSEIEDPEPVSGVAEPASLTLLATGGGLLAFARRFRRR